jgi:two-component system nitrogen regulation sensor histidine kinase NtrY
MVLQEVAHPAIIYTMHGETHEPLFCDGQQLGRVFTNLLKNAAEAIASRIEKDNASGAKPVPGTIDVAIAEDTGFMLVTITDNGIGLPAESRERLTEPYITTRTRGTGLGLAIVKKIVEDHGGGLELDDAPGGGAMVRVRIARGLSAITERRDAAE